MHNPAQPPSEDRTTLSLNNHLTTPTQGLPLDLGESTSLSPDLYISLLPNRGQYNKLLLNGKPMIVSNVRDAFGCPLLPTWLPADAIVIGHSLCGTLKHLIPVATLDPSGLLAACYDMLQAPTIEVRDWHYSVSLILQNGEQLKNKQRFEFLQDGREALANRSLEILTERDPESIPTALCIDLCIEHNIATFPWPESRDVRANKEFAASLLPECDPTKFEPTSTPPRH